MVVTMRMGAKNRKDEGKEARRKVAATSGPGAHALRRTRGSKKEGKGEVPDVSRAETAKKANPASDKLQNKNATILRGVDDYISRWRCGIDDIASVSSRHNLHGEVHKAQGIWQSKDRSKVYSGKGEAIKALLLRNRKAFLKPPEERTFEEIEEVHNLISQTLQSDFFSKYNTSIQKDMAAAMKMEHFKANEVVFCQGDQPGIQGKYYIIAYGRVRITVEQVRKNKKLERGIQAHKEHKMLPFALPWLHLTRCLPSFLSLACL